MKLYNTLSKSIEILRPIDAGLVRMYSCGPTVYRYAHLGNLRSYLMADWIRRVLEAEGLKVIHVKNITDVGHMRQEVLERGEDKVIASALAEGKSPQEIALFYTEAFHRDEEKLGIRPATYFPKATDHVSEMIQVTQRLIEHGYAYEAQGNVYFSVSQFPEYGRLSGNTGVDLLEGVRAEVDPLKKDPRDFTLWKAAEQGRVLKWSSPWGQGFPGWHIECSAMATKYLGEHLDIHTGGVDNIFPHHEGEIAQSEGAFGNPFVQLWVHGQHLMADGVKMAKSTANDYTLEDLETKGFEPMAFRYLCLTAKYGSRLNFTFTALIAAQRGLHRLRHLVWEWSSLESGQFTLADGENWSKEFWDVVSTDLDMPRALALTWVMSKSSLHPKVKLSLILEFDEVLGLSLADTQQEWQVPISIDAKMVQRSILRGSRDYEKADNIREQLDNQGFLIEDGLQSTKVRPKSIWEQNRKVWQEVSSSKDVESLLSCADVVDVTLGLISCNYLDDLQRCIKGMSQLGERYSVEIIVVDNGSSDGSAQWLEEHALMDTRLKVIHTDHVLGEATAKNIILKQSLGEHLILMDTSVEVTGDFLPKIVGALSDKKVGVAGSWGLRSKDLRNFYEIEDGYSDSMQAYCFAFRRASVLDVDLMRESFRFYRNLDLEYSFCFLDKGYQIISLGGLPLKRHEHRVWTSLSAEEREKLSLSNFRRFLKRWGNRRDLLIDPDLVHHDHDHDHD